MQCKGLLGNCLEVHVEISQIVIKSRLRNTAMNKDFDLTSNTQPKILFPVHDFTEGCFSGMRGTIIISRRGFNVVTEWYTDPMYY